MPVRAALLLVPFLLAIAPALAAEGPCTSRWLVPHDGVQLNDVAVSGDVAVAVGDRGTILLRETSGAWTAVDSPISEHLNSITTGTGGWVAVGDGGAIAFSSEGRQWTAVSTRFEVDFDSVEAGESGFLAIGGLGAIVSSLDGLRWELVTAGSYSHPYRQVAYGAGTWLLVGVAGILRSSDGTTFEPACPDELSDCLFTKAIWNGSAFVLSGPHGTIVVTATGEASEVFARPWGGYTSVAELATMSGTSVAFVHDGSVWSSPDGTEWTESEQPMENAVAGAAPFGGGLLVVGRGGAILRGTPSDGWTVERTGGDGHTIEFVAVDGDRALLVSHRSINAIEGDLLIGRTTGLRGPAYAAGAGGGRFVVSGRYVHYTSGDGVSWTEHQASPADASILADILWTGERFLAVAYPFFSQGPVLVASDDGVDWERLAVIPGGHDWGVGALEWNDGQLLRCSYSSLYTTTDGITWSPLSKEAACGQALSCHGDWCIGRSEDSYVTASFDGGRTWRTTDFRYSRSIVAGELGALQVWADARWSPDGISWIEQHLHLAGSLRDAVPYRDGFLVAGDGGMALQLTCPEPQPELDAAFVMSPMAPSAGASVLLEDRTSGGRPTQWRWSRDGDVRLQLPPAPEQEVLFNDPGTYHLTFDVATTRAGGSVAASVDIAPARDPGCDAWVPLDGGPGRKGLIARVEGLTALLQERGLELRRDGEVGWQTVSVPFGKIDAAAGFRGQLVGIQGDTLWRSENGCSLSQLRIPEWDGFTSAGAAASPGVLLVWGRQAGGERTYRSTDSVHWHVTPVDERIADGDWSGEEFILVSRDGPPWYSADGLDWSRGDTSLTGSIAAGAGEAVVLAMDGRGWRRVQGEWQEIESISSPWTDVAFGPSGFLAVGYGGRMLSSRDGETWTALDSGTTATLWRVEWAGDRWLVTGDRVVLESRTGHAWRVWSEAANVRFGTAAAMQGRVVAIQYGGDVWVRDDGAPWRRIAVPCSDVAQVVVAEGRFLASSGPCVMSSPDGVAWTVVTETGPQLPSVTLAAGGDGWIVGIGRNGRITRTRDFLSWEPIAIPLTIDFSAVAWGGGRWLVVGGTGGKVVLVSEDTSEWELVQLGEGRSIRDVIWHDGLFHALAGGELWRSPDGVAWTRREITSTDYLYQIEHDDHGFVVLGDNALMTSPDGDAWSTVLFRSGKWSDGLPDARLLSAGGVLMELDGRMLERGCAGRWPWLNQLADAGESVAR